MKKILLSLFTLMTFASFGFSRWRGILIGDEDEHHIVPDSLAPTQPSVEKLSITPSSSPSDNSISAQTPTPISSPEQTIAGGPYKDGQYLGSVADAYYGYVRVEAVINNGYITDVKFLQYPNDRSTSRYINNIAMPRLTQEAINSQSAKVQIVSGATDTSGAFRQSLAYALNKAQ